MEKAVGIDFGTTNSVIAVLEGGEPTVIPNQRGERLTPSVVAFDENGGLLVGAPAKNQSVMNYPRTVMSVKRKIGTDYTITIDEREYTPEHIASFIINKLKKTAEEFIGGPVKKAIITVPAYFNDGQRNAVKKAGEMAGLEVMRLINEPTAAALSFDLPGEGTLLVFDLGGGTFDVSILDMSDRVCEVMATRGNNKLGGDDFDAKLIHHICKGFYHQHKIDLHEDLMALQKVRDAAEQAKKELSESDHTSVTIPFISADQDGPKHLELVITRMEFENLIRTYLEELEELVDGTLEDAGLMSDEINYAILVGGSTRIPAVQKLLEEKFSGRVIRNSNPDECVAAGAAVQAGIITGDVKGLVLVDVTPLTLGIQTENDVFIPIIERNSCIPTGESKIFTTVADNQCAVEVHVLQGERKQASLNYSLGTFVLEGIDQQQRGKPRIEVTFDIDVNGLVHVSARDKVSGLEKKIEIAPVKKLTAEEAEAMVKDAEKHREDDELFLGRHMLTRQARSLLEVIRHKASTGGPQADEIAPEIQELIEYIENVLTGNDLQQIRNAIETMNVYLGDIAVA